QAASEICDSLRCVATPCGQQGEIESHRRSLGVFWSEFLFVNRQGSLVQRLSSFEITFSFRQCPDIVERNCDVGVIGTECLLFDRQYSFAQRRRFVVLALV